MEYAAAFGRMMVLKSKLFRNEQLGALCNADSFNSCLSMLANSPYENVLASRDKLSPQEIEHVLKAELLSDYRKLSKFVPKNIQPIIAVWAGRFELANIKTALRAFREKKTPKDFRHLMYEVGKSGYLNFDRFLECASLQELAALVNSKSSKMQNPYTGVFRKIEPLIENEANFRLIEQVLELDQEETLYEKLKMLSEGDLARTHRYLDHNRDIKNTLWFARFRLNFDMPFQEIRPFLSKSFMQELPAFIKQLDNCKSMAEIMAAIPQNIISNKDIARLGLKKEEIDIYKLEVLANRTMRANAIKFLSWQKLCLGSVMAYLELRDYESRDLITILTGKSLDMPASRIIERLSVAA